MLPSIYRASFGVAVLLSACALAGCDRKAEAGAPAPPAASSQALSVAKPSRKAAKLVFLDKEEACACTQAKIDSGLTAIKAVIGEPGSIPMERIHMDTQQLDAQQYLAKKRVVGLPALYVLDSSGNLIELLQGEMDEAGVRRAVGL